MNFFSAFMYSSRSFSYFSGFASLSASRNFGVGNHVVGFHPLLQFIGNLQAFDEFFADGNGVLPLGLFHDVRIALRQNIKRHLAHRLRPPACRGNPRGDLHRALCALRRATSRQRKNCHCQKKEAHFVSHELHPSRPVLRRISVSAASCPSGQPLEASRIPFWEDLLASWIDEGGLPPVFCKCRI